MIFFGQSRRDCFCLLPQCAAPSGLDNADRKPTTAPSGLDHAGSKLGDPAHSPFGADPRRIGAPRTDPQPLWGWHIPGHGMTQPLWGWRSSDDPGRSPFGAGTLQAQAGRSPFGAVIVVHSKHSMTSNPYGVVMPWVAASSPLAALPPSRARVHPG